MNKLSFCHSLEKGNHFLDSRFRENDIIYGIINSELLSFNFKLLS